MARTRRGLFKDEALNALETSPQKAAAAPVACSRPISRSLQRTKALGRPHLWSDFLPTRLRKLIGTFAILLFLLFYVGAVVALADHLPNLWFAKLIFFLVAGVGWGVPLLPLLSWMNKGR